METLISNGNVFVLRDAHITALSLNSGQVKWTASAGNVELVLKLNFSYIYIYIYVNCLSNMYFDKTVSDVWDIFSIYFPITIILRLDSSILKRRYNDPIF